MAAPVIQFKRGQFANLPALRAGEPGFTTDKYDLYVGIDSTTSNNKFFGSHRYWTKETGSSGSGLRLVEGTDNGENYIELKSPDNVASNITYTFPGTITSGGYLLVDSSGNLSWDDTLDATNVNAIGVGTVAFLQSTTVNVSAGATVTGALDVDGGANLAGGVVADTLQVSDLTDGRVVLAGASGEIEDSANLTFGDNGLTVTGEATVSAGMTVTGAVDFNGGADISGYTELDDVNVSAGANVAGIATVTYAKATTLTVGAGATVTGALDVDGGADIAGGLVANSAQVSDLTDGRIVLAGASGELQDDGDLTFDGETLTTNNLSSDQANISGVITATSFVGDGSQLTGISQSGDNLTLGSASDGSLTDGALINFTSSTSITDSVDDLNELALNVIKNTAVAAVDFTSSPTNGPSPLSVTLTITSEGNANRFDIDWGDGNTDTNTSDSTPSHTYTEAAGGTFTVEVTAKNSNGVGAGSSQTKTRTSYITVYTPAPAVAFDLFRASTGGSALSGNDLWVRETQVLYLDNNTTNATGVGATYTVNWGDGTTAVGVASDTDAGGSDSSAARLSHTWAEGTSSGTSQDTVTLTIEQHNTTDPAEIPKSGTVSLKVYDNTPTDPDGLSSKTLPNVSSTGTSPKLTADADDRTGGTSLSAGDSVNRVTSGTATAGPLSSFAYNADSGTLTAAVNGTADGARILTSGDDSATYTSLVITEESDYQLLNAGGTTVTFANSIYYPNNWKGFKASVAKAVADMSVGVNKYRLEHSSTGNTNEVEFVVDKDVTSTPTSNIGSATLTENTAGTKRFISGIPYYNSGSPDLTLSGVTIDDLTGQTYSDVSNVVEVDDGTNQESTTSNAIANTDYTYANIDGSTTMLDSGIPKKNIGVAAAYAIGDLTVPITSSSVRTVSRLKVRARNVNGVGSYSSDLSTNVQVHTAAQSGISEIAIAVADSLGSTYDDDGVRIFDFAHLTADNPAIPGSTNFYTNNVYTESADPGISTTREAVLRLGNITHDQDDYSSGYLPAGPDLSSSRSGTQYFTFAFRRATVANFNINITSTTGIAGLWIAAPGTDIDDTSGLNGWLAADTAYAGSGIPGSDTGNGGNGSDGCAQTTGDRIVASTALSGSYTMTLGSENLSNATNNVALIRIGLADGDSITALSIS